MYVLLIVLEIGLGRGVSKDRFSRGRSWFGRLYVCGKYVTMYVCMYAASLEIGVQGRPRKHFCFDDSTWACCLGMAEKTGRAWEQTSRFWHIRAF